MQASCHCGNIHVQLTLTRAAKSYNPRACDCDFCRKHGAAYVSDPEGALTIQVRSESDISHYRQGSGQADFLVCRNCGVLAAVLYRDGDKLFAALNSRIVDDPELFGEPQSASPKKLNADAKVARWTDLWFKSVRIE